MVMIWPRVKQQEVTVVVDEINVAEAMDALETLRTHVIKDIGDNLEQALEKIEEARVDALMEIMIAKRRLNEKVTEAKAERGKLESAVGTARSAGRRTGGRTW